MKVSQSPLIHLGNVLGTSDETTPYNIISSASRRNPKTIGGYLNIGVRKESLNKQTIKFY
jgi:hypothetical protein